MAASATVPLISVEKYLNGEIPEIDIDYVDGVLEERNLGEFDHASLQGELFAILYQNRKSWQLAVYPELRVQVAAARFRVVDVCVLPATWSKTRIVREAPMLCIEVLSSEDTLAKQRKRAEDYIKMGVREVWIFDPEKRKAYVLGGESFTEFTGDTLRLEGTQIEIDLRALFSVLDF